MQRLVGAMGHRAFLNLVAVSFSRLSNVCVTSSTPLSQPVGKKAPTWDAAAGGSGGRSPSCMLLDLTYQCCRYAEGENYAEQGGNPFLHTFRE